MGFTLPALFAAGAEGGADAGAAGGIGAFLSSIFGGGAAEAGAVGAGDAAAAAATGAGAGSLDAVAAGLTPAGGALLTPGTVAADAALGAGAGALGADAFAGAPAADASGGFNAIDAAAGQPGVNGAAAAPTIAPPAAPAPTGGISAGGLAGPSGGSGAVDPGAFNSIDAAAGQPGVNGFPAATPAASTASPASSGVSGFLKSNPGLLTSLGVGAAGTVLSPMISKLINKVPQQGNLDALAAQESGIAGQQAAYGSELQQPLLTGVLPAQQQQVVDNATNDAISTTKARYANLGLSGSTMEADAIASISSQKLAMQGQLEQQMASLGSGAVSTAANALSLQDQVYSQLMNAQISQDNNLQSAIARFAAAAATGKSGSPTIQIGGNSNA